MTATDPPATQPTAEDATEAGTEAAQTVYASKRAADLVDAMVKEHELWNTRIDAALFLGALALYKDEEPVDLDAQDRAVGHVAMGELSSVTQSVGDAGELELFGLLVDPDRRLDDVLREDLKDLIEAGADLLRPVLESGDPLTELHALLAEP